MKKLAIYLGFLLIGFGLQAQVSPAVVESFSVRNEIIPVHFTTSIPGGTIPLNSKKEQSVSDKSKSSTTAFKSEKITFIDTIKVIVYDTIKVQQSKDNSVDSVVQKTENKAKEGINNLGKETKDKMTSLNNVINFGNIFWSIIILIFSYFFIKFLVVIIERFAEKSTTYRIGLKGLSPFVKITGWIIALVWIVEGIFQPPHATVLAFLASAGIAIGFASQDILKNIFGGIMILFDRPFQVGDKIEVGNYYGEVTEIGLRCTRIVTKDDSMVSIPNAEVVNSSVSNSNAGEANCQVVAEIHLPIDVDTNLARVIATEAAQVSRFIYLNKPITVLFFNDVKERRSYIKMRLKAYVSDIRNEFSFQSDMTEIVIKEFIKRNIIKKDEML